MKFEKNLTSIQWKISKKPKLNPIMEKSTCVFAKIKYQKK